jgi:hypothetical protein
MVYVTTYIISDYVRRVMISDHERVSMKQYWYNFRYYLDFFGGTEENYGPSQRSLCFRDTTTLNQLLMFCTVL